MIQAKTVFLHALTPVHTGTGQSADVVDLPIAREKATGWPLIPATGLKGVWRASLEAQHGMQKDANSKNWGERVFGDAENAGAFCFTDQRILCLPVRSFFGTFAYATCPLILSRFVRDRGALGLPPLWSESNPNVNGLDALIASTSALHQNDKIYLEDIDFPAKSDPGVDAIAESLAKDLFEREEERQVFRERFILVSNEVFTFLSETATEISAQIKLEAETKTTTRGSLRYEEAVPAETIFSGMVVLSEFAGKENTAGEAVERTLDHLKSGLLQIGGKATSGRGLCRVIVAPQGGAQ